MADREPHHAHLAEMRADRVVAELRAMAAIAAVPCRALWIMESDASLVARVEPRTGRAALRNALARYAADREADRLRQCYPDPTRRHLMEMRLTREEVRRG